MAVNPSPARDMHPAELRSQRREKRAGISGRQPADLAHLRPPRPPPQGKALQRGEFARVVGNQQCAAAPVAEIPFALRRQRLHQSRIIRRAGHVQFVESPVPDARDPGTDNPGPGRLRRPPLQPGIDNGHRGAGPGKVPRRAGAQDAGPDNDDPHAHLSPGHAPASRRRRALAGNP